MATYSVLGAAGAPVSPTTFFQAGATFLSGTPSAYNLTNPSGTIVAVAGSGFSFDAGNLPTGGTVESVTLYQSDFAVQLAGIGGLSLPLVDLHARWLGPTPGSVFGLLFAGADTIAGSAFDDTLHGFGGADSLLGSDGNDYLDPGRGSDTIEGGDGLDTLSYSAANNDAAITAGVTVDLTQAIVTDPWGDTDTIVSIERARGTRFADSFIGNDADNRFEGLGGADSYDGGAGIDRVSYQRDAQFGGSMGVSVNLDAGTATDGFGNAETFAGIEQATGTDQADTLNGGDTAAGVLSYDVFGLGGDDIIIAGAHDFYAEPGAGTDTITAGPGFDQISYSDYTGGNGATINLATFTTADPFGSTDTLIGDFEGARGTRNADTITGNALNNRLAGLAGNDTLDGGEGLDRARYDRDAQFGGDLGITVDLATGLAVDGFGDTDTLVSIEAVQGTEQGDTITAGSAALGPGQAYELYGRGGSDTLVGSAQPTYYEPGAGDDTVTGGASLFDLLSYSDYTGPLGVTIDLSAGTVADPFGGTDNFTGIEAARGTLNADTLTGDGSANQFTGLAGTDTLDGGDGTDLVRYDRDERFAGGTAGVFVDLAAGTGRDGFGDTDSLTNIEQVRGSNALMGNAISLDGGATITPFGDALYGDGLDNLFQGLRGADLLDGRGGRDTADYSRDIAEGGAGGVTVDLAAGTATDGFGHFDRLFAIENVIGTAAADTITGDAGDNVLQGGGGDDTLTGGAGNDTIDGGAGSNTTVFAGIRGASEIRYDAASAVLTVLGPDGVDTLANVATLQFADRAIEVMSEDGVRHLVSVSFPQLGGGSVDRLMIGGAYVGPVAGLTDEFVFPTIENINVASTLPNAFIRTGAGNDAISVASGRNVIDAFTGSNFLTGGSGQDTFFLDARGGGSTWDTIVNFGVGDEVTLWGYVAGVSKDGLEKDSWYASEGVDPFKGLTVHAKLDGTNFGASITFAGLGLDDRASLAVTTGNVAGNDYLYITRIA